MKLHRVLAIARKNLLSLRHDRRTVGFLVGMPLLMIAIFGYTFGGTAKNLDVYIVNQDQSPANVSLASVIINDIGTRDTLHVKAVYEGGESGAATISLVQEKVKDAHAKAAIIFGPTFTQSIRVALDAIRNGSQAVPGIISLYIDGTNPNVASAIIADLQVSIQKTLVSPGVGIAPPVATVPNYAYGQGARFIDFFAPGVMGLAAMMVTFMLSIISFVHERSAFTLDRLLSTPVTEGEIVAGYALAFGFVGLLQSIVILSAAIILFQISIVGNVLLVLAVIFIFGIGNQGLGFLLSSIAKNEFQAIQFLPIILFPSILLAGVFWPIEAVPTLLRPVSYGIPLTYAVDALRSVMIRGWGADHVWVQLVFLVMFAGVMLSLSALLLKRRR